MTTDNTNVATEQKMLTRRQVITSAAVGGAALVVSGLCGAAAGSAMTTAQYEIELTKLRALVALYEQLEKIGIDAIIQAGMNVVRGALDTIKGGVSLLRDGVTAAENALTNFQSALNTLQGSTAFVVQALSDLSQKIHNAEGVIIAVLGTALPLADSIAGFFNALLQKIPFGIGDDIRRAVTALTDLIRAVPAAITTVSTRLIQPVQDMFFPSSGDPAVKSTLVDPITKNVLEPLKKLLTDIESLLNNWETNFTTPVQAALTDRQKVRDQIAQYKKDNGMV